MWHVIQEIPPRACIIYWFKKIWRRGKFYYGSYRNFSRFLIFFDVSANVCSRKLCQGETWLAKTNKIVLWLQIITLHSAYTSTHRETPGAKLRTHLNGPCIKSLPAFITLCLLSGAKLYFLVSAHISKITWNLFLWKSLRSLCMFITEICLLWKQKEDAFLFLFFSSAGERDKTSSSIAQRLKIFSFVEPLPQLKHDEINVIAFLTLLLDESTGIISVRPKRGSYFALIFTWHQKHILLRASPAAALSTQFVRGTFLSFACCG